MTCAYWDEEEHRWSIQGVTTIGTSNGELRCETTHLSIFAGAPRFISVRDAMDWVRGLLWGYTWLSLVIYLRLFMS